jgi:CRP/FNR family transcriptional regulator
MKNKMQELKVYPFFLALSQEEQERFVSFLKPIRLPKETIIHYQGDVCKDVLLLVEGEVRIYTQADDFSEEVTLYSLKAGEQCLVNTASVLSHSKSIGTAVTMTDIKAYALNEKELELFMSNSPLYQQYVMSLYSKKMVELTMAIQRIKFQNLDERIMDFLFENEKKTVSITHQKLAQSMNTSRCEVYRVLKKLEEKGEVVLHRGYIELLSN